MSRSLSTCALLLTLATAPFAAFADSDGTTLDAATQDKLTTQLVGEGYDVRQITFEGGVIEVYAVKDGETVKLFFNDKLEPTDAGPEADE